MNKMEFLGDMAYVLAASFVVFLAAISVLGVMLGCENVKDLYNLIMG